jgi:hypothetical protein
VGDVVDAGGHLLGVLVFEVDGDLEAGPAISFLKASTTPSAPLAMQPVPPQTMILRSTFSRRRAYSMARAPMSMVFTSVFAAELISSDLRLGRSGLFAGHDVVDDLVHVGGLELAVHLLVHHEHGGEAAGSDAVDGLDGHQHVVAGVLAVAQLELLPERLEDRPGALDVARGAVAKAEDVLALRLSAKCA